MFDVKGKDQPSVNSNIQGSRLLKDLIESSKNLPTTSSELGTIQLGSNELKKRLQTTRSTKSANEANFTKAHYLLAGSGVAIEDLESEIKSVELPNSLENSIVPAPAVATVDFDSQLDNKKDENILAAIEQSLTTAARDFDSFVSQNLAMDWRKRKGEIYKSFGFDIKYMKTNSSKAVPTASTSFSSASTPFASSNGSAAQNGKINDERARLAHNWGKSTIGHSVLGPRLGGGEFTDLPKDAKLTNVNDYSMRDKFEKYSIIIYQLNNFRQQLKPFPVATCFLDATKEATDSKTKQISECWRILSLFIDESENNILPEQYYYNQYSNFNSKNSSGLRNRIVRKSTKYLESQFLNHVNVIYHKKINDPSDDTVIDDDGLPTNLNKVKYYVKSQKKRLFGNEDISKNLLVVNDVPIWALIFYLIRSGCYEEAVEVVDDNASIFNKIDSNFSTYMRSFADSVKNNDDLDNHSLSASLENSVQQDFNNNIKNSLDVDPYRYAVYKIIGKCDLSKKSLPKLFVSVEDWLWTNFMLINENSKDTSKLSRYESYTLVEFQKNLISYGASYFNNNLNNPIFIQVLLLGGLFELAVKHAFSISEIDSIHLAIGLTYYGLLRAKDYDSIITNNKQNDLTLVNSAGLNEINYARLIGYYTRSFRVSDTKVALEYLLLINLASGGNGALEKKSKYSNLTLEAIRELVIETREFSLLLGTINKDGSRYPGRIENRQQLLYINGDRTKSATGTTANAVTKVGTPTVKSSGSEETKSSYLYEIIEQAAKRVAEEGRVYDSLLLYQLSENHNQVINIINRLLGDLLSSIDIFQPISKENEQEYSPIEIGEKLLDVYNLNPSKITSSAKEVLKKLLLIAKIKTQFIAGNYENTLILIKDLDLIPISSTENLASIRIKCQEFNHQQLDYNLIKSVGNLLLIAMTSVNQLIKKNSDSQYSQNDGLKNEKVKELVSISKQIMMFAGMVQYRMSKEVYIKLTQLELLYS